MSIEEKIAELLAESQAAQLAEEDKKSKKSEKEDEDEDEKEDDEDEKDEDLKEATDVNDPSKGSEQNPANKKNNVDKQEIGGKDKSSNVVNKGASAPEGSNIAGMKEDIDALINGEQLTEEFKEKAAVIFEAAVLNRVKQEVAKLDEAYHVRLDEEVESIKEGLVEKVDGYLGYVTEQWLEQNEIALEQGMKSDILESFVGGLRGLFEEHYIDVPEEKYDVLGSLEEQVNDLRTKLDEQFETSVELRKQLDGYQAAAVVAELSEGMVETDKERFVSLIEELDFDGIESFTKKAQIVRENYFVNKSVIKKTGNSVVTDTPVINEETNLDPLMKSYLSVLNNTK